MRYPASEKLEIIRLVEQSHLPVRRTLEQIGVSRPTFYRWYDRYQTGGPGGAGGQVIAAEPRLEPDPGRNPPANPGAGSGGGGAVAS
jgi:transposase-like protein